MSLRSILQYMQKNGCRQISFPDINTAQAMLFLDGQVNVRHRQNKGGVV